jgi:hypothetical protein
MATLNPYRTAARAEKASRLIAALERIMDAALEGRWPGAPQEPRAGGRRPAPERRDLEPGSARAAAPGGGCLMERFTSRTIEIGDADVDVGFTVDVDREDRPDLLRIDEVSIDGWTDYVTFEDLQTRGYRVLAHGIAEALERLCDEDNDLWDDLLMDIARDWEDRRLEARAATLGLRY